MNKTKHITKRMTQRGITQPCLDAVLQFGHKQGESCVLNKKTCQYLMNQIDKELKKIAYSKNPFDIFIKNTFDKGKLIIRDKADLNREVKRLRATKSILDQIQKVGGYKVIIHDNQLITAYRLNSYSRNLSRLSSFATE